MNKINVIPTHPDHQAIANVMERVLNASSEMKNAHQMIQDMFFIAQKLEILYGLQIEIRLKDKE